MELYATKSSHRENNLGFVKLMERYSWADFKQPNKEKAPWHWQMLIQGQGPYTVLINIWPHVAKAQREGEKTVQGWMNIRSLIAQAIDENGYGERLFEEGV